MGKTCRVLSCSKQKTIKKLFKVPLNSLKKPKWIEFLEVHNIKDNGSEIFLCDSHFESSMIINNNSRSRLSDDAFPSIDPDQQHPVKPKITIISNKRVDSLPSENLLSQIAKLSIQLYEAKEEAVKYKSLYEKTLAESNGLKKDLERFLNQDQLKALSGIKVSKWSDNTIQKGIILKQLGGSRAVNFTRKHLIPLAAPRTIQKVLHEIVYQPGVLLINLHILKLLTENFTATQLRADIKIDEKSLVPGRNYDFTTQSYVGAVTIPASTDLAKNVFAVLLTLMEVRIKLVVGYHFTGNSFDVGEIKKFLYSLIKSVEECTNVRIDMLTCDMGPSNCSLIKLIGLNTTKGSRKFFVEHPQDPRRKLRINFDPVHHIKNLAGALRRHDIVIPANTKQRFNLISSKAQFKQVISLFKKQMKYVYKPCPSLKPEVVYPDHFEVMRESTAMNLINEHVSCALDFIYSPTLINKMLQLDPESPDNPKTCTTAFILRFFNRYSNLLLKTVWTTDNFEENSKWLLEEAVPLFESLKFDNAYVKCTTGAVINILSTVDLIKEYLSMGMSSIKAEWLSSNSIENFFSQIVNCSTKPSALQFTQALKSITLSKYMEEALDTKIYSWSNENISCCGMFLKYLKNSQNCKKENYDENDLNDKNLNLDPYESVVIDVPDEIHWSKLFKSNLEFNSFFASMNNLIEKFMLKVSCDNCKSKLLSYNDLCTEGNILSKLHFDSYWEISLEVQRFLIVLEYVFRELSSISDINDCKTFKKIFADIVVSQVDIPFEHCSQTIENLIMYFASFRLKLELHCRLLHSKNKFASKN